MTEPIQDYYDADVAKLNALAMKSAERAEKLKAENEKLRELVRQMYPKTKAFMEMAVQLGCNDSESYDWWLQIHKLGIEVDG